MRINVLAHNQEPDEKPAHRVNRELAFWILGEKHADRIGEAIRLKPGRSLQSLKAEYRGRPKVLKSEWIPETLPPAEVQGITFQDPARKVDMFAVRGRSILIRMAREWCNRGQVSA